MTEEKVENKDLVFTITMKPEGTVNINGPLTNKPICLWMLEVAKNLMMMYQPEQSKIQPAKGSMMDFARKRFK
jgi:hypothetical protein